MSDLHPRNEAAAVELFDSLMGSDPFPVTDQERARLLEVCRKAARGIVHGMRSETDINAVAEEVLYKLVRDGDVEAYTTEDGTVAYRFPRPSRDGRS